MAIQSFEIGTTYAGRVNVETLTTTPNMAPRSKFFDYAESQQMASGVAIGRGNIYMLWDWGWIPADMFAALRVICPGASAAVFIRTLKPDYTTYAYYQARMLWPALDSYEYQAGKYRPFGLTFDRGILYTP